MTIRSRCCNAELIQNVKGWMFGFGLMIGFTNTEYICSKCKRKFDAEDVVM